MRILYRQSANKRDKKDERTLLSSVGIENSYFKLIEQKGNDEFTTKKKHSHTGFEFHMVVEGSQTYDTDNGIFKVSKGNMLAVPKGRVHAMIDAELPLVKYAATFAFDEHCGEFWNGASSVDCCCIPIPERILSNARSIVAYRKSESHSSDALVENCVFETVILLLQAIGVTEVIALPQQRAESSKDARVELAKQFVSDNIETQLSVSEIAAYCYLSEKQLTRLFMEAEGCSPGDYIRRQRMLHIEEMLRTSELSLGEISRIMNFPSEAGFNTFFKKNNGMPPGEYRKMINNHN